MVLLNIPIDTKFRAALSNVKMILLFLNPIEWNEMNGFSIKLHKLSPLAG